MLLLKEEFPVHFHLLALVVPDLGDQVVESEPVRDAEHNQTPSYRRSREPGIFATNWKARVHVDHGFRGWHPGRDNRKGVDNGEE